MIWLESGQGSDFSDLDLSMSLLLFLPCPPATCFPPCLGKSWIQGREESAAQRSRKTLAGSKPVQGHRAASPASPASSASPAAPLEGNSTLPSVPRAAACLLGRKELNCLLCLALLCILQEKRRPAAAGR
ncbi:hypothetical protein DV515_00012839 [Chloebia gouldiae]|uniref:Uncharacterized protein n=1 Tax=Chloebia gouldiae TaxID=44316 RepID=A0A3L8S3V3_CHLGU|nr:hypothetical protein DV515_00012839 [Chloebia gouldiae]